MFDRQPQSHRCRDTRAVLPQWRLARRAGSGFVAVCPKGVVTVPRSVSEDDLMAVVLDAGAEDLRQDGGEWVLISDPSALQSVRDALEAATVPSDSAELAMVPTTTVEVSDETGARKVLRLLTLLEDHDDVQN